MLAIKQYLTEYYTDSTKLFVWIGVANFSIAMFQVWSAYSFFIDAKYWNSSFSIFLGLLNIGAAYFQVRTIRKVLQRDKDKMWEILSTSNRF